MFNFKKAAASLAVAAVMCAPFAVSAAYEDISADKNTINIIVDAKRVVADNFLYNNTTYVPLRRIAEMLDKSVTWVESESAAYIADTDTPEITTAEPETLLEAPATVLSVEKNVMTIYVNGEKVDADNFVFEGTTYVPLRRVSEMFAKEVSWDQLTNTATIGTKMASVFDGNVAGTFNGRDYTDKLVAAYKRVIETIYSDMAIEDIDAGVIAAIKRDYAIMDLAIEKGVTSGVTFENEFWELANGINAELGSDEAFNMLLAQSGFDLESYHHVKVINDVYSKLAALDEYNVSDEDAKAYYDANYETQFKRDAVRAKHVLIQPGETPETATEAQWKEAEATAKKVYDLAKGGEDFDKLVDEYNDDPGMIGNLEGYTFERGEMVNEFEEKAFSMQPGEISEPVKTQFGYHVIKLEEKVGDVAFEDTKERIAEYLESQKLDEAIEAIVNKAE